MTPSQPIPIVIPHVDLVAENAALRAENALLRQKLTQAEAALLGASPSPATPTGVIGTVAQGIDLIFMPSSGVVSSVTVTFANIVNAGVENASLADGRWELKVDGVPVLPVNTGLRRLRRPLRADAVTGPADAPPELTGNLAGALAGHFAQSAQRLV